LKKYSNLAFLKNFNFDPLKKVKEKAQVKNNNERITLNLIYN